VFSQDIYNNSSIFIPAGLTVYVDDIRNFGFIQNNGTLEVEGDWENGDIYQGLGTVILSGTNQDINNNGQAVQSLLIDGDGAKSLEGKLVINGSIEFASGIFRVGREDTLLVRSGAHVEGGSASSFVEGKLTIEGTGYKFFPVGRKNSYYPITLTQVRGVDPVVEIVAYEDLGDIRTSRELDINYKNFWTQRKISGSYDGSPVMVTYTNELQRREKMAFVAGREMDKEFDVVEDSGTEGQGVAVSKDPIDQLIIAIGKIPAEPITPGYMSTTLSPNAQDPANRHIRIFGNEMGDSNFSFKVFNRWGDAMFESTSFAAMTSDGWDGRHNGQLLPAGAYPYFLSYVDQEGREGRKTGFITIVY
jgi:gliding motility-associated-like protein